MDGTDLVAFVVFMGVFAYLIKLRYGGGSKQASGLSELQQQLQSQTEQIQQLNQRVATLETIITDKKFDLVNQIDNL